MHLFYTVRYDVFEECLIVLKACSITSDDGRFYIFRMHTRVNSPSWKRVPCEEEVVGLSRVFDRCEKGSRSAAINRPMRKFDLPKYYLN